MVNPAMILAMIDILSSAYSVYATSNVTKASDTYANYVNQFYNGSGAENSRYWADYIHKHHLDGREIKYPFRTGYNFNYSQLYNANAILSRDEQYRQSSIVNGVARGSRGYSVAKLYGNKKR